MLGSIFICTYSDESRFSNINESDLVENYHFYRQCMITQNSIDSKSLQIHLLVPSLIREIAQKNITVKTGPENACKTNRKGFKRYIFCNVLVQKMISKIDLKMERLVVWVKRSKNDSSNQNILYKY
jgi:hypothetical protein